MTDLAHCHVCAESLTFPRVSRSMLRIGVWWVCSVKCKDAACAIAALEGRKVHNGPSGLRTAGYLEIRMKRWS